MGMYGWEYHADSCHPPTVPFSDLWKANSPSNKCIHFPKDSVTWDDETCALYAALVRNLSIK